MRGVELRVVTTAAVRALTQILLVGVAHLTYACQQAACSSRATLTSFEGANGRPVFGLRRGRTAPMWQRCTPRALTRAYAHNG